MTVGEFQALTAKGVLLLDGATGSNLRAAGMPVGVCTEQWVLRHPAVLMDLQRAYAGAGSRIVYAPSFSANRVSLEGFGLGDQVAVMNKALVRLSKEAVGDRCLVAGDITTTGKALEPAGDMSIARLFDVYCEQAAALAEAGADLIVAETMLSVDETTVALDAVRSVCGLPVMCTLTLEADGSALWGGNGVEAVETLQELGAAAVGVNCSVGPDQLAAVVRSLRQAARVPIIAKPNAGHPVIDDQGRAHYSMGPAEFARHMRTLVEAGASIVGGCCGTTPEYIRAMAEELQIRS